MKRLITLTTLVLLALVSPVKAAEVETYKVKATAYSYNSGSTATGTVPKEGRTLAGKREWFGKTVVVWLDNGNGIEPSNYLGTYICEDTGGDPIKKGYVVDVYISDYDRAVAFGGQDVIIQIIDSEG